MISNFTSDGNSAKNMALGCFRTRQPPISHFFRKGHPDFNGWESHPIPTGIIPSQLSAYSRLKRIVDRTHMGWVFYDDVTHGTFLYVNAWYYYYYYYLIKFIVHTEP